MVHPPPPTLEQSLTATLDWWRAAGVDCAFLDEPQPWLAQPEAEVQAVAEQNRPTPAPTMAQAPRIGGDSASWPGDLAPFRRWWVEDASLAPLLAGAAGPAIPPRGEAGARLMVLVPMPEEEDSETLLSGPQGRLISAMARAMGLVGTQLAVASALPAHVRLPDWPELEREGLGAVLRHHLSLAAPERLLVLGRDCLPLLGHDPAQAGAVVQDISVPGRAIPMLAGYTPASLLEHARLRAALWRQWLEWTSDEER